MPPKIVPARVQETDYSQFTVEQIKKQLAERGLETTGKKKTLVKRLKAEVQRAWNEYYSTTSAFPPKTKALFKKKEKKKMTLEEVNAQLAESKAKRKAKLKRKAENIAKMEEAR